MTEGKLRLLEVQEVLAEREFEIGKFYYLRGSYPASIARLQSLVDKYPLYSRADEALFLLGQNYEGQIAQLRARQPARAFNTPRGLRDEAAKASYMLEVLTKDAAAAVFADHHALSADGSRGRRQEAAGGSASADSPADQGCGGAEQGRRRKPAGGSTLDRLMAVVKKGPDVAAAVESGRADVGGPDPVARTSGRRRHAAGDGSAGRRTWSEREIVKAGAPGANEPAPRSDAPAPVANADPFARPNTATAADPNELKPMPRPMPNEPDCRIRTN